MKPPKVQIRRVMDRYHWILVTPQGKKLARSHGDYGRAQTARRAFEDVAEHINANLMERIRQLEEMKGATWNK